MFFFFFLFLGVIWSFMMLFVWLVLRWEVTEGLSRGRDIYIYCCMCGLIAEVELVKREVCTSCGEYKVWVLR